ncbi:hypothetical protein ROLI_027890 [Roseobacter fucihabitans]|uniref:Uncharacterized protein n=1 Tax=Roseobacter fucihabitans TaxID=1537242 RepID=A0ABZ2BUH5_9RHOB|nr:hypothetical protein [Roseobacter litoralis]
MWRRLHTIHRESDTHEAVFATRGCNAEIGAGAVLAVVGFFHNKQ